MAERTEREVLSHLIEVCKDGERGFLAAAERVGAPGLKSLFTELAAERARFAADLVPHLQRLGGHADEDGTSAGTLHRGWIGLKGLVPGHHDHTIVTEAKRGEHAALSAYVDALNGMLQTETSYLGFRLPHPFIAGASPFGRHLDSVRRLEDAGCAAVVLHSLFEEQITAARGGRIRQMDPQDRAFAETLAEFPRAEDYPLGPDAYAEHISRVKQAVKIPVIGSLNGTSPESWLKFARIIEQAGADALELNPYEVYTSLTVPAAAIEAQLAGIVAELKRIIRIPIAVKVSPYFTAFGDMARRLATAGADGLVLFNRFYQTDIDIKAMRPMIHVELSTSSELLLRLHWLAILYGRVRSSLAVTGGVVTPDDGIKAILAGADVVQMVSALLRHGPSHVQTMRLGLERWMEWHKLETLIEVRGRVSLQRTADSAAFERANYIQTLQSWGR
jgi:dihydroorotate dehydrogenase (fumarate)